MLTAIWVWGSNVTLHTEKYSLFWLREEFCPVLESYECLGTRHLRWKTQWAGKGWVQTAGQFSVPRCRSSRFLLYKLKGRWIIWFGCVLDGHGEFASHSGGSHFLYGWRLLQQRDRWRCTDPRVFSSNPILTMCRYHFWHDMCVFKYIFANWTLCWLRVQTGSDHNCEVFQIIYLKIKCENWKN